MRGWSSEKMKVTLFNHKVVRKSTDTNEYKIKMKQNHKRMSQNIDIK